MAKKVVIVGLENLNLGDRIIEDTCKYLVEKLLPDAKIKVMNLFPPENIMNKFLISYPQTDRQIEKFKSMPFIAQILNFSKWKRFQRKGLETYKYYEENLKKSKMVIFAGGGLIKYTREDFWNTIYSIISYCNKARIHVYFNAIGIEGFDKNNFYCHLLKHSLNKKCVKVITTRDDIETLKKYTANRKKISLVGDSALWTPETYNIEFNEKKDIIGIGLIRGKIFTDYGINFDEDKILQTYIGIIKELEKRNYKWQLFCNGLKSDYKMGKNILKYLNLPETEEYLVPRPTKAISLIKTICSYKATISARLHASIIAVAYSIPNVGLIWNDKLKFFGQIINKPNQYIPKEEFFYSSKIINRLEESITNGYNQEIINNLKNSTLNSLKEFIDFEMKN